MATTVIEQRGVIYSIKPYPKSLDNPAKWRWMIYRDGMSCGRARTKVEAVDKIRRGDYEQASITSEEE